MGCVHLFHAGVLCDQSNQCEDATNDDQWVEISSQRCKFLVFPFLSRSDDDGSDEGTSPTKDVDNSDHTFVDIKKLPLLHCSICIEGFVDSLEKPSLFIVHPMVRTWVQQTCNDDDNNGIYPAPHSCKEATVANNDDQQQNTQRVHEFVHV